MLPTSTPEEIEVFGQERLRHLKIKIKSLGAEAVIIRKEENKLKLPRINRKDRLNDRYDVSDYDRLRAKEAHRAKRALAVAGRNDARIAELHNHRVYDVRGETRAALLAYALLRGKHYREVEPNTTALIATAPEYAWLRKKIARIIDTFTPPHGVPPNHVPTEALVRAWLKGVWMLAKGPAKVVA